MSEEQDPVSPSTPADTVLELFRQLQQLGVTPRSIRVGEVEVQVASMQKPLSDAPVTVSSQPTSYLSRALDKRDRSMR